MFSSNFNICLYRTSTWRGKNSSAAYLFKKLLTINGSCEVTSIGLLLAHKIYEQWNMYERHLYHVFTRFVRFQSVFRCIACVLVPLSSLQWRHLSIISHHWQFHEGFDIAQNCAQYMHKLIKNKVGFLIFSWSMLRKLFFLSHKQIYFQIFL